jgi:hypothetical protein
MVKILNYITKSKTYSIQRSNKSMSGYNFYFSIYRTMQPLMEFQYKFQITVRIILLSTE